MAESNSTPRENWKLEPVYKSPSNGCGRWAGLLLLGLLGWAAYALFFKKSAPVPPPPALVRDTVWVIQKPPVDTIVPPPPAAGPSYQSVARKFFATTPRLDELAPGDRYFFERKYARAATFFKNKIDSLPGSRLAEEAEWRLALTHLAQSPAQLGSFNIRVGKILEQKSHPHRGEAGRLKLALNEVSN